MTNVLVYYRRLVAMANYLFTELVYSRRWSRRRYVAYGYYVIAVCVAVTAITLFYFALLAVL